MKFDLQDLFVFALRKSMMSIRDPRFFESERGYQGALLAQLTARLDGLAFEGDPIIEQEYQKTLPNHGINIRPDLIVHVPFERGQHESRSKGNFVAIEIKRRATEADADGDFASLALLVRRLSYALTIFINIDSSKDYFDRRPSEIADQTLCFAVRLENETPVLYTGSAM